MAHKTLIDGTAYAISGGKTLVNGTAYSIKNGKTLVGGTAYGINFAPSTAIITITGTPKNLDTHKATITIDGTTYDPPSSTIVLEVAVGTIIECSVLGNVFPQAYGYIYLNGSQVGSVGSAISGTYEYTVIGNTDINMVEENASSGAMSAIVGKIYITEE